MSFNLLDTVKGFFNSQLLTTAGGTLGESETSIQKAVSGAVPAVLAGIIGKAHDHNGADAVLSMANQAAGSALLNNISGFLGNDNNNLLGRGAEMLKGIFGDKAGSIAGLISNFAGIKHSSASSIISMIAPVALGALGNHAADNNLSAGGLMHFLQSQKESVVNALPASLSSVAGLFGVGVTAANTPHISQAGQSEAHVSHDIAAGDGGTKFLVPLLLGVFAVALGIYFFKGCEGGAKEVVAHTETTAHATEATKAPQPIAGSTRESMQVKLPDGTMLNAYQGGIEDKLVAFLNTDYKKLGPDSLKNKWFDFDNLNFETASANITAASQVQVNNIAAILKAYPTAQLKIGGYTDKVGVEAENKKLSDARAKSVQAALEKAGVGKQITGAEGYGSAFAIYAADAPEADRVKDRHVSVSVR